MIFREKKKKIIKDINESGMPIDAIYFIMKDIMREIEEKYIEYCNAEDIEKAQQELENENEENTSIEKNDEGTN